jgi:hypothetical protein
VHANACRVHKRRLDLDGIQESEPVGSPATGVLARKPASPFGYESDVKAPDMRSAIETSLCDAAKP